MKLLVRSLRFAVCAVALLCAAPTASANNSAGEKAYQMHCSACHSPMKNGIGPSHAGVFGRKASTQPGFDYSPGFAKANITWNDKTLDEWLTYPDNVIPGQKMGYYVSDAEERKAIIAYLKSLGAK